VINQSPFEDKIIEVVIADFNDAFDVTIDFKWAYDFFRIDDEFWPAFDDKMVGNFFEYYELDLEAFSILSGKEMEGINAAIEEGTFVKDYCIDFTLVICILSMANYYAKSIQEAITLCQKLNEEAKYEEMEWEEFYTRFTVFKSMLEGDNKS
jgi:hypothetical protein